MAEDEMVEAARLFTDKEIFTDGQGRPARRLVMEFDEKIPGPGWGKATVADKVADFATAQIEPYRKALGELVEAMDAVDPDYPKDLDAALTAAKAVLTNGEEGK